LKTVAAAKTSVAYVPPTTTAFKGKRKIFRIAPWRESGTYFERRVPAAGMNRPTQASKTKKLATVMKRALSDEPLVIDTDGTAILTAPSI